MNSSTPFFTIVPPGLHVAVRNRPLVADLLRSVLSSKLPLESAIRQLNDLPTLLVERGAATSASYEGPGFVAWDGVRWATTDALLGVEQGLDNKPRWQITVHLRDNLRDIAAETAEAVFGKIAPSPFTRTPLERGVHVEFPHNGSLSASLVCAALRSFDEMLRMRLAQAA